MRGTHASVGVGTEQASLKARGSVTLVGIDDQSCGVDLVTRKVVNAGVELRGDYPPNIHTYPDRSVPSPLNAETFIHSNKVHEQILSRFFFLYEDTITNSGQRIALCSKALVCVSIICSYVLGYVKKNMFG